MRTVSIPQYGESDEQTVELGASGGLANGVTLVSDPGWADYRLHLLSAGNSYTEYSIGVPVSDQFIHLDVGVIDNSSVRVTLESLGPDGATASVVLPDDVPIRNLTLTNGGVGYLPDAELYFNNIQITPEPSGTLFLSAALWATLLRGRRRLGSFKPYR